MPYNIHKFDFGNTVMPIGLDKGKMFKDIPLGRLDSFLGWLEDHRTYADLQRQIAQYLKDSHYNIPEE